MRKGAWGSGPGTQVSVRAAEGEGASDDGQKQAAGRRKEVGRKSAVGNREQESREQPAGGAMDDVVVVVFVCWLIPYRHCIQRWMTRCPSSMRASTDAEGRV